MPGQPDESNLGGTDWLLKATPDQLVAQAKAVFQKVANMDRSTQDRVIQEIKNDPSAYRLFQRIGETTT